MNALMRLVEQLEWRGPNGKMQGHIVLTREQAIELFALIRKLETSVGNLRHE